MINDIQNNAKLPLLTKLITDWHHDRNLIAGATLQSQTAKLLEEFTEVVASLNPDKEPTFIHDEVLRMMADLLERGRIKTIAKKDATPAFKDALGDMFIVQVNLAEQIGVSAESCIQQSWDEIKDRKGRMIDGQYVKEADLV